MATVQAPRSCPQCNKSDYRTDGKCNKCGFDDPVPAEFLSDNNVFSREGHAAKGRIWDSKLHKYVLNKG